MIDFKTLVVSRIGVPAKNAMKLFPGAKVVAPYTALVGHRFERIIMCWQPKTDHDAEWVNVEVAPRLKFEGEMLWLV